MSARISRVFLLSAVALTAALAFASSASAKDKYSYTVLIRPAAFSLVPDGDVFVERLDPSLSYTISLTLGGIAQVPLDFPAGRSSELVTASAIAPGDTITIEQPTGVTQESFTVPDVSIAGTAGSPVLTGTAPDGMPATARRDGRCVFSESDFYPVEARGGAFSVKYSEPLVPGDRLNVSVYPGAGDSVSFQSRVPGETPCLYVDGYNRPALPGSTPSPEPYEIEALNLRPSVGTGARLVLRRAGAPVVDYADPSATTFASIDTAVQPLPGDTVELYRPHTAPTPSATYTIPMASATYDPTNNMAAIDGPPASLKRISVEAQLDARRFSRSAVNTPNGRTLLSFAKSEASAPAVSLANRRFVFAEHASIDGNNKFTFAATQGDLAPPVLKLKLAKRFKLASLKSSLPASVTSSEPAAASLKLTLPAKLSASASASKSARTIATAKLSLTAGTKTVRVKLTQSGKRLIAKLQKARSASQMATLTVTAKDSSGNASTRVTTTRLVSK